MRHLIALASWVMPSHTRTKALAILLRWVHLLAGITGCFASSIWSICPS
jgi:hypothetical protein